MAFEHTELNGNYYGTSKQTVTDQRAKGRIVLLDIDVNGARQIKHKPDFDARYVFIRPPTLEALEIRLRARGTESEEEIQKRLARAKAGLDEATTRGVYDIIITNDNLDKAFAEVTDFIQA